MRKRLLLALGLIVTPLFLFIAISACQSSLSGSLQQERPNVLLIMTDDQGWGDIYSHGNPKLDTPVMDRLAGEGARFNRFFVSPVCAPTRASLLTGRYHGRTGVFGVTRGYETMRAEEVTIAEVFKEAGYATGSFGKWHNGAHYPHDPNGQGFEEYLGFNAGHWNNYFDTHLLHNGKRVATNGYITDVLTKAAAGFIKDNSHRPFLCYVPYNAPHSPWQVPERYFQKYKQRGFDDKTAAAYGMVENLDDNIGQLLETLEAQGLKENTIVVFLTDNGANSDRYDGHMRGRKGSVHEGGVRVPLFIRWPGQIKPGRVVSQIAAHIDLLPTLMELAGVAKHPDMKPLDGQSLAPLLQEKTAAWPNRKLFTHRFRSVDPTPVPGAVRTQRWRAVNTQEGWALYDMQTDPGEQANIAQQHPEVLKRLSRSYKQWFADVTAVPLDTIPVPIGYKEQPEVTLPGHEAFLYPAVNEGISYVGRSGWANDWVTNWTSSTAYPYWKVNLVRAGRYKVSLLYTCPREEVGSTVQVEIGDQHIAGTVEKAHDPKPVPSPDRVARKEVYEKEWAQLTLGTVRLPKGPADLSVKASRIAGQQVMDLKAVRLRRVQ